MNEPEQSSSPPAAPAPTARLTPEERAHFFYGFGMTAAEFIEQGDEHTTLVTRGWVVNECTRLILAAESAALSTAAAERDRAVAEAVAVERQQVMDAAREVQIKAVAQTSEAFRAQLTASQDEVARLREELAGDPLDAGHVCTHDAAFEDGWHKGMSRGVRQGRAEAAALSAREPATWTLITDDPKTWPPCIIRPVVVSFPNGSLMRWCGDAVCDRMRKGMPNFAGSAWINDPPAPPEPEKKSAEAVIANVLSNMNEDDPGQADKIAAALRNAGLLAPPSPPASAKEK